MKRHFARLFPKAAWIAGEPTSQDADDFWKKYISRPWHLYSESPFCYGSIMT
jgi:hypothetical protein